MMRDMRGAVFLGIAFARFTMSSTSFARFSSRHSMDFRAMAS